MRTRQEYDKWHIPGAVNIPLRALRARIGEIPDEGPVLLYCRVGFRSYLAYRILCQSGFERAAVLAGGSKTFNCYHRTILATGKPGVPFVAHAEEELTKMPEALDHA